MFVNNKPGLYPSIFLHHSNFGQLAIGGAMINLFLKKEEAECFEAKSANGGWRTRFDGGDRPSSMPCDLVAMYVEGLHYILGYEGAYEERVETYPSCYGVVVNRWRVSTGGGVGESWVYLRGNFSFSDRISNDGVYNLKEAHEVVHAQGHADSRLRKVQKSFNQEEQLSLRSWHLVSTKRVPGRIRQVLNRTIGTVRSNVDEQFGQGKEFFVFKGQEK